MEQDTNENREEPKMEEATVAEKAADQNRRKRLLKKIIEYHMESVHNSLTCFESHLNFFADDEDFEDREEIMEDLAKSVQAHCEKICAILDSHKWKGEQEANWHFNPWKYVHFVVNH
jgi:transcription termination factor NusB